MAEASRVTDYSGQFQGGRDQWNGNTIGNVHIHSTSTTNAAQLPRPSAIIPFRRDTRFVARDVLSTLKQRCSAPSAYVALVGLGGTGKTQLATEYAYWKREVSPDTWVLWVHASSVARFEETYRTIAERMQVPGWNDPQTDTLSIVCNWLSDENHGKWLMVLDNADDDAVLFNTAGERRPLKDYLPTSPSGSIVVTSRDRAVARGLIDYEDDILSVNPMTASEAELLVLRRLDKQILANEKDKIPEFISQLDRMPLAITHALAYINRRVPHMTIGEYTQQLNQNNRSRSRLLSRDPLDIGSGGHSFGSILLTWHMSFEHVRRRHPTAAQLLSLMSMFDREGIPARLLRNKYSSVSEVHSSDFADDVSVLKSFDLINNTKSDNEFEMHRIVQSSTQKWLVLHDELEHWQQCYTSILDESFPQPKYQNWAECERLFPHIMVMVTYKPPQREFALQWAAVLQRVSDFARKRGRYAVAERFARQSWEVRHSTLGEDHPDTLSSVYSLASTLDSQGQYQEAEQLFRRALGIQERVLGEEHPDTLTSIHGLAGPLYSQGRYQEAEQLLRRVLGIQERVLGEEHPDTLMSICGLTSTLHSQGRYTEEEEIYQRLVPTLIRVHGNDHDVTLTIIVHLAMTLVRLSRFSEAIPLFESAMTVLNAKFGSQYSLSVWARELYQVALEIMGTKHKTKKHKKQIGGSNSIGSLETSSNNVSAGSRSMRDILNPKLGGPNESRSTATSTRARSHRKGGFREGIKRFGDRLFG